jgi:hypothetical protein
MGALGGVGEGETGRIVVVVVGCTEARTTKVFQVCVTLRLLLGLPPLFTQFLEF